MLKKLVIAAAFLAALVSSVSAKPVDAFLAKPDQKLYLQEQYLYGAATGALPWLQSGSFKTALLRSGPGPVGIAPSANSQFNPQFMGGGESIWLNELREFAGPWTYGNNTGHAIPSDVNVRGYPLPSSNGFSNGGYLSGNNFLPSQYELTDNRVAIGVGQGRSTLQDQSATNGTGTGAACVGAQSNTNNISCDNQACTAFTAGIVGQVLTVTVASSCGLVLYQPISTAGIAVNAFGVPTGIIGNGTSGSLCGGIACTGVGGTGTYLVNWSQTIAPGSSFIPGFYNEISVSNEIVTQATNWQASWNFSISATSATAPLDYMAVVPKSQLAAYFAGQLVGTKFKQRIQAANFKVMRGLNIEGSNLSSVTTWNSRKPSAYWSYSSPELRTTPCSGFTVSPCYAGAASYTLVGGTTDQYSVNLGGATPPDKMTVCVAIGTTATTTNVTFSTDGGATSIPVKAYRGNTLVTAEVPYINRSEGFTYNADLGTWLSTGSNVDGSCIRNFSPPEAIIQANVELGTVPYIAMPMYASTPITDYPIQYQLLLNNVPWSRPPIWAIVNEPWNNGGQGVGCYTSIVSKSYITRDPTHWTNGPISSCGGGGDTINWIGFAGTLLAQSIRAVSSTANVYVGLQTTWTPQSNFAPAVRSTSYVAQNTSLLPIQNGCAGVNAIQTSCPTPFRQTAFYQEAAGSVPDAGGIEIANYASVGGMNAGYIPQVGDISSAPLATELALAYCYFYQSTGCASQSSLMTSYFTTGQAITQDVGGFIATQTTWLGWYNFASTCGSSCGASNPLKIKHYEGAFSQAHTSATGRSNVSGAANGTVSILAVSPNGCAPTTGQAVTLSGLSGTGWIGVTGSFAVQQSGTDSAHCALNLDSTGFGTLGSTTTATANWSFAAATISVASCPALSGGVFAVYDTTQNRLIGLANSCTGNTISGFQNSAFSGTAAQRSGSSGNTLAIQPVLTYTNSSNYVNYLRDKSWNSPDLASWTTLLYNTIASTSGPCAPAKCGDYPSQFNITASTTGNESNCCWSAWGRSIYNNGLSVASVSAATASGGNLTLGGTVSGIFTSGLTLLGGGISGATITGACSQTGALPAGANSGDVCPISSGATMASNALNGVIGPTSAINNPITLWKSICAWNGNAAGCN